MQVRGLNITLGKQKSLFWIQLSRQKYGWIKKDTVAALCSDSESDPGEPGQPEAGFIFSYPGQVDTAGRHGKTYHHLTCPVSRRRRSYSLQILEIFCVICLQCEKKEISQMKIFKILLDIK